MKIIMKIAGGFDIHLSKDGKDIKILDRSKNELSEDKDYEITEKDKTSEIEVFLPTGVRYSIFYDE